MVNLSCTDDHDVAFQNVRMMQGLGVTLCFFLGVFFCVSVKLYILVAMLVVAILGYAVVEYRLRSMDLDQSMELEVHEDGGYGAGPPVGRQS